MSSILNHGFYLGYCIKDKIKSRQLLANLCAQVGSETDIIRKNKAIEVMVEYINRYPSFGRNLHIIAELTDKQISNSTQPEIQIINEVAKEILNLIAQSKLSSAVAPN